MESWDSVISKQIGITFESNVLQVHCESKKLGHFYFYDTLGKYGRMYSWTFNFHKVVRQQNLGVVEDLFYRIPQFIYESKSERIIEIGPH